MDRFILADGLTVEELRFVQGLNGSQIRIEDTNELLATVHGFKATFLDYSDFVIS